MNAARKNNEIKEIPFDEAAVEGSVKDRFEEVVRLCPDQIALKDNDQTFTFQEMNEAANRMARVILDHRGVGNEPIVLLFGHGPLAIIAVFAVLKAGKIYVALDPKYPAQRNRTVLEHSGAKMLLTDTANLPVARKQLPLDDIHVSNVDDIDPLSSGENLGVAVSPDDPMYILYTSGSTGEPKGPYDTNRATLHWAFVYAKDLFFYAPGDRVAALFSYSFGGSLGFLYALLAGATLHFYDLLQLGMTNFMVWLQHEEITVMGFVTSLFRQIATHPDATSALSSLRRVLQGGDAFTKHDIALFQKTFPPQCKLINLLAASEIASISYFPITHDTHIDTRLAPVGRAMDGVEILIVDESGKPVQTGEVGEILITSAYLAMGYWNEKALTAEKFLPVPGSDTLRTYLTGDLGRLRADGNLDYLGRKDFQVKIRGYRVEPAEIEVALVDHPAIQEAVVNAIASPQGEKQLAAYLIAEEGALFTASDLRDWLSDRLPDFMIPAHFITMDALPRTVTGKVDRLTLPVPKIARPDDLPHDFVGSQDGLEQEIQYIWESVFGFSPIGVIDDFFALGGHSLLALQIFDRLERELHRSLTMDVLFEASTIREMAAYLHRNSIAPKARIVVPLRAEGDNPPLFLAHARAGHIMPYYALTRQLGDDQPVYGIQARGLDGKARPVDDLPSMAKQYVNEIRKIQPQGPYYLGGLSMGGMIAFEMALQLQAAGEDVGLVAMMDTYFGQVEEDGDENPLRLPADGDHAAPPVPRTSMAGRGKAAIREDVRALSERSAAEKIAYLVSRFKHFWRWYVIRLVYRLLGAETAFHEGNWSPTKRIKTYHFRAATNYRPARKYDGRAVFFKASTSDPAATHDAWAEWVAGDMTTITLEGSHRSILEEPIVQEMARELQTLLLNGSR